MPIANRATVVPNQPWSQDGTASVTPEPPFPDTGTRTLPLVHLQVTADIVVPRSTYPNGVVIIPMDSAVSGASAVLPLVSSTEDEVVLDYDGHQDWPDGVVVWFT